MSYFKQNVNQSKRVGMDGVFLGLAGLLLGISLKLRPWEIPSEQPCQPSENPVHPSSFNWITPFYLEQFFVCFSYITASVCWKSQTEQVYRVHIGFPIFGVISQNHMPNLGETKQNFMRSLGETIQKCLSSHFSQG